MRAFVITLPLLLTLVVAKEKFVAMLPNGANVKNYPALGHVDSNGGGKTNTFGDDFDSNGKTWSKTFCMMDSDGDGATNGEELLDPCCTWKVGATLSSTGTPTHPGIKNTFTAEQLAALKCSASVGSNSTNSTGNSNTSAITSPPPATIKSSAMPASVATAALLAGAAVMGAML